MIDALKHINAWLIDLDNVVYDADAHVHPEMIWRIYQYMEEHLNLSPDEAKVKRAYFRKIYGGSMRGLVDECGVDPAHFMDYAHRLDRSSIPRCDILAEYLPKLPGQRIIFTNSIRRHVEEVLDLVGVRNHFDGIFDVADAGYCNKPMVEAYEKIIAKYGLDPQKTCFIDDSAKNLKPAHEMGLKTVWIHRKENPEAKLPYVDFRAESLARWLQDTL